MLYGFYVFVSINTNCLETKLKERRGEVDFPHADNHQTFMKVDTINFIGHGQSYSHYPNIQKNCLKNGHMWLLNYDMGIISFLWQLKIIIK